MLLSFLLLDSYLSNVLQCQKILFLFKMNLIRSYLVNVFLWILVYLQNPYRITLGTMGRARTTWLWIQSHSVLCSPIFGLNAINRKITVIGLLLESQEKRPVKDTISKENITPHLKYTIKTFNRHHESILLLLLCCRAFFYFNSYLANISIFPFYTPWKHQKTFGFLVFSAGIK